MKMETFTEVYNRYAKLVMKSVVAQTGNFDLAEDICQKVFVRYFQHFDEIDHDYAKTWLLHTAKNLLIDHWRKASTRNEYALGIEKNIFLEERVAPDMEKQCLDREFVCRIMENLKKENAHWHDVIDYVCVREMTQEEAAKELGIKITVLRARLYRARQFIQDKYGAEYLDNW